MHHSDNADSSTVLTAYSKSVLAYLSCTSALLLIDKL
jgi:hypothetical protein